MSANRANEFLPDTSSDQATRNDKLLATCLSLVKETQLKKKELLVHEYHDRLHGLGTEEGICQSKVQRMAVCTVQNVFEVLKDPITIAVTAAVKAQLKNEHVARSIQFEEETSCLLQVFRQTLEELTTKPHGSGQNPIPLEVSSISQQLVTQSAHQKTTTKHHQLAKTVALGAIHPRSAVQIPKAPMVTPFQHTKRKVTEPPIIGTTTTLKRSRTGENPQQTHDNTGQETLADQSLARDPSQAPSVQRTILFNEVYQDGKAQYKHKIFEYKYGSGNWYIVKCDEHDVHFKYKQPVQGAAGHLRGSQHDNMKVTYDVAMQFLGYLVTNCNAELAELNNREFKRALENGYEVYNRNIVSKSRQQHASNWEKQPDSNRDEVGIQKQDISRRKTFWGFHHATPRNSHPSDSPNHEHQKDMRNQGQESGLSTIISDEAAQTIAAEAVKEVASRSLTTSVVPASAKFSSRAPEQDVIVAAPPQQMQAHTGSWDHRRFELSPPPIQSPRMGPPIAASPTPIPGTGHSTPIAVIPDASERWQVVRTPSLGGAPQKPRASFIDTQAPPPGPVPGPGPGSGHVPINGHNNPQSMLQRPASTAPAPAPTIKSETPPPSTDGDKKDFYVCIFRDLTRGVNWFRNSADAPYLRLTAYPSSGIAVSASAEGFRAVIEPDKVLKIESRQDTELYFVNLVLEDGGEQMVVFEANSASGRLINAKIQARHFMSWIRMRNKRIDPASYSFRNEDISL